MSLLSFEGLLPIAKAVAFGGSAPNTDPTQVVDSSSSAREPTDKPIGATNRTSKNTQKLISEELNNDVLRALEGVPKKERGSRERPSVMSYPTEIGTGQLPHVMQFKVFWRWENKDVRERVENVKMESSKTLSGFRDIKQLIDSGSLTPEAIQGNPKIREKILALKEVTQSTQFAKAIDPTIDKTIEQLLIEDPIKAKFIVEETIKVYQNKVSAIQTQLDDGVGKIGPDEIERDVVTNRILSVASGTGITDSSRLEDIVDEEYETIKSGFDEENQPDDPDKFEKEFKETLKKTLVNYVSNSPQYDQMVSIYLPFCTKINNEDTFQYGDSGQAIPGGVMDILGGMSSQAASVDAAKAAAYAAGQLVGDAVNEGTFSLFSGRVINPRLEKLFKQKDFRNFNFSWEFYPKNSKEVEQVREIVEAFRYHSHPAKDTDQSQLRNAGVTELQQQIQIILRVPAEFEIRFLSSNPNTEINGFVENEYLPKIARCALTSISVDYTPNGIYSSLIDNSPSAISLTMQFSEMGVLTRDAIERGY